MVLGSSSTAELQAFTGLQSPQEILRSGRVQETVAAFKRSQAPPNASRKKHIEVLQGEFAFISLDHEPNDGVVVSSDCATTCVIVVAHCQGTKQAFVAHFDRQTRSTLSLLCGSLQQMSAPRLYMVGAYESSPDEVPDLLVYILRCLQQDVTVHLDLSLFCCGSLNTSSQRQPIVQGLAYCTATMTPFIPSQSLYTGPLKMERGALMWAENLAGMPGERPRTFYNSVTGLFELPLATIQVPSSGIAFLLNMIESDDEDLLQACSTSPEAEKEDFPEGVQCSFQSLFIYLSALDLSISNEEKSLAAFKNSAVQKFVSNSIGALRN